MSSVYHYKGVLHPIIILLSEYFAVKFGVTVTVSGPLGWCPGLNANFIANHSCKAAACSKGFSFECSYCRSTMTTQHVSVPPEHIKTITVPGTLDRNLVLLIDLVYFFKREFC